MSSTYGPTGGDPERDDGVYPGRRHERSRDNESHAQSFDRDQAEREARAAIGNARDELQSLLERQKNAAADQVQAVAEALRGTEDSLRDKGQDSVAAYVGHVADRIDYWSGRLRERHIEALGQDIQNLARRQPGLFIAGAIVVGFVATRFLKSTQTAADRRSDTRTSDSTTPADSSRADSSSADSSRAVASSRTPSVATEQERPGMSGSVTGSADEGPTSSDSSHH